MRATLASFGTVLTLSSVLLFAPVQSIAQSTMPTTILPLEINRVVILNGELVAIGSLGRTSFQSPITLSTVAGGTGECPILNLELQAINLDLLGLVVETSDICLRVTAVPGGGALLGNLLCSIAGLLDDGLSLGAILDGLSAQQLSDLLGGLTDLLNDLLGELTAPTAIVGVSGTGGDGGRRGDACDILNLAVGPVDLNLLGLDVELDDCDGGPVTVDITAESGSGRLLGNLLCQLSGLLDRNASDRLVARVVNRIVSAILDIL